MTAEPEPDDREDSEEQRAYFGAIEELFVRLRGAPLLLSPSDWHVIRRWRRFGVPLDLVGSVLQEIFQKRQERGLKRQVLPLRFCTTAVDTAWAHLRELTAPAERAPAATTAGLDIPARLATLAAALPEALKDRAAWAERITVLAALPGGSPAVEERLADLDRELLEAARAGLKGPTKKAVAEAVERTLAALAGRLPAEELERSRDRLFLQVMRGRLGLPVLSLFSPEAEGISAANPTRESS
jgi:hypothetical protein